MPQCAGSVRASLRVLHTATAANAQNSCMTVAARNAVAPCTSCGGETVLTSNATKLRPASWRSRASPSLGDRPPHSGVQTPGAQDGSKMSMSKHRYTGRSPICCLMVSSAPRWFASNSSKGMMV